jgi:hypothetical protein
MSYSAYVLCSCYQNGIIDEPPHKEYVVFDEDGLDLTIPADFWTNNEETAFQMLADFTDWTTNACEHEEMELCSEYLATGIGMGEFREAIKRLGGKDRFPVLDTYLPTANGGALPAELAVQASNEIEDFENQTVSEDRIVLIETSTNTPIATVNADTYLVFVFTAHNRNHYGIDKDGFFIRETIEENGQMVSYVVFRSKKFTQQYLSKETFQFIDSKTNDAYVCDYGLHPYDDRPDKTYEFEIREEKVKLKDEYSYLTEPLKKLAKASIESGNPICWC